MHENNSDRLGTIEADLERIDKDLKELVENRKPSFLFQAVISTLLSAAVILEAWMLTQIIDHRGRLGQIEQWQATRPDFTTKDQAAILVTMAKEEVRKEINAKLDTLIAGQTALQLQLARHEAETKKP